MHSQTPRPVVLRVVLDRVVDDLEEIGQLLQAQALDRRALQDKLDDALLLALAAVEELEPSLENRR